MGCGFQWPARAAAAGNTLQACLRTEDRESGTVAPHHWDHRLYSCCIHPADVRIVNVVGLEAASTMFAYRIDNPQCVLLSKAEKQAYSIASLIQRK